MANRPALPMAISRQVKVEAGHRCAIPVCRAHPIEIAHIEPRSDDGSNDVFDNLIALCPNCHTRYDKGEIDRPAMRQYKANLSVLNGRYGEMEQRILRAFADDPKAGIIMLPEGLGILLQYLIQDELLIQVPDPSGMRVVSQGIPAAEHFAITDKGREFIDRWLGAEDLEST